MTASDSPRPARRPHPAPLTADDLFDASEPARKAEDLARSGVFDEGEVEELLADLYAIRRSDVA
jgi:hypothetical protein